jgi:hypothetical protein
VLFGGEFLNNEIGNLVGAMQLQLLLHLKEKALVITLVT